MKCILASCTKIWKVVPRCRLDGRSPESSVEAVHPTLGSHDDHHDISLNFISEVFHCEIDHRKILIILLIINFTMEQISTKIKFEDI